MTKFVEPTQAQLEAGFASLADSLANCHAIVDGKGRWLWTWKTYLPTLVAILFPGLSTARIAQVAHTSRLRLLESHPNKLGNWTSNTWSGDQADRMLAVVVDAARSVFALSPDEPAPLAAKGIEAIAETPEAKAGRETRAKAIRETRKGKGGQQIAKL